MSPPNASPLPQPSTPFLPNHQPELHPHRPNLQRPPSLPPSNVAPPHTLSPNVLSHPFLRPAFLLIPFLPPSPFPQPQPSTPPAVPNPLSNTAPQPLARTLTARLQLQVHQRSARAPWGWKPKDAARCTLRRGADAVGGVSSDRGGVLGRSICTYIHIYIPETDLTYIDSIL